VNIEMAAEAGIEPEQVQGVLVAIAPVIGGAAVAAAGASITRALGMAIAIGHDLDED
jgi:4-carboxymuconolactone decarboxylase